MSQPLSGDARPRSSGLGVERLPRRQALADSVAETIKDLLMEHRIAPGDRVSIDGLASELGVSPTPVREALGRLESTGLVSKEAMRGYRATPLMTDEQIDDLYGFRLLIEPWASGRAAERITEPGRKLLSSEMDSIAARASSNNLTYKELAENDARFHLLIAELAGSEQVRLCFERTHWHLHILRLHFETGIGSRTFDEHRAVADAVAEADATAARQAMSTHLEAGRDRALCR